jgi:hypothetical protein
VRTAAEAPPPAAPEAPSEQAASDSHVFYYEVFYYEPSDGERELIGMWSPAARDDADGFVRTLLHRTNNRETSERWRAELAAGRLP